MTALYTKNRDVQISISTAAMIHFAPLTRFPALLSPLAISGHIHRLWLLQTIDTAENHSLHDDHGRALHRGSNTLAMQSMYPIAPIETDAFCFKQGPYIKDDQLWQHVKNIDPAAIYLYGFYLNECVESAAMEIVQNFDIPRFIFRDLTLPNDDVPIQDTLKRLEQFRISAIDSSDFLRQFNIHHEAHLSTDRTVPEIPRPGGTGNPGLWSG